MVVVASLVGWLVARQAERRWQTRVAEMEQHEPDWRWEQIEAQRRRIPDDENSAQILVRIESLIRGKDVLHFERRLSAEPQDTPPHQVAGDPQPEPLPMPAELVEGDLLQAVIDLDPTQRLTSAIHQEILRQLEPRQEIVALALPLADRPFGRHPLNLSDDVLSTPLPTQSLVRGVGGLLILEAQRRSAGGDWRGASTALRAAFNAARSIGDEPLAISCLIRQATAWRVLQSLERLLAQGDIPPDELIAWQQLVALELADHRMEQIVKGERATLARLSDSVLQGKVDSLPLGSEYGQDPSFLDKWAERWLIRQSREETLRLLNEFLEFVRQPIETWNASLPIWQDRFQRSNSFLVRLLLPSLTEVMQVELRYVAFLRAVHAALACERFRQQKGHWPNHPVIEQTPDRLATWSTDPYTGQPLVWSRRPFGLQIWSVGPDGQNDGGAPIRKAPPPLMSRHLRLVGDIGFALYDPRVRGLDAEILPLPPLGAGDPAD
jgi:hypothetical protein